MTYSHNFGAKYLTFNSSIKRLFLVAITLMNCRKNQLTLGIEIKTRIKREK